MDRTDQQDLGGTVPEPFEGAYCRDQAGRAVSPPRVAPATPVAPYVQPIGAGVRSDERRAR